MDYRPFILLAAVACQPSDGNGKKRDRDSTDTDPPAHPGYPRPSCAPEDPGPTLLGAGRYSIGKGVSGSAVWLDGTFLSTYLGGDGYAGIPGTWYSGHLNAAGLAAVADAEARIGASSPTPSGLYPSFSWSELVVCRAGVEEVWVHSYMGYGYESTTYGYTSWSDWVRIQPEIAPAWDFFMGVWGELEACAEDGFLEDTNGC